MTAPADKIWAYLHHELAPDEAECFDLALDKDPALREALEDRRSSHETLTELDSGVLSNEQIEEQLLAEWAAEHPEYAEKSKPRTGRKFLQIAAPLAAAAALVLLLTLPSGPIRWQRTVYGNAPQWRGESAAQPHYTRAELKQAARELQAAVEAAGEPVQEWTLRIYLQELANGTLAAELSGSISSTDRSDTVRWNESFQSLENFRQNVPRCGKQIADEL